MSPPKKIKKGKKTRRARGARDGGKTAPKRLEVGLDDLRAILGRAKDGPLNIEDVETLSAAVETLAFITQELEASALTIERLTKLLFGSSSEKTRDVLGERTDAEGDADDTDTDDTDTDDTDTDDTDDADADGNDDADADGNDDADADGNDEDAADKPKRKGHGRNGASAYTGAKKVCIAHGTLTHGAPCPECDKGRVYRLKKPKTLVRVRGVAPLDATVYEIERLRCNLCGTVFTADTPPGVGTRKYDATAAAMIALLKYGTGLPFNRLERLGKNLGIPLPAATQWDVVDEAATGMEPVFEALISEAADGDVLYIDDTNMPVLELMKQIEAEIDAGEKDRTGIFTSGVVSTVGQRKIALFYTGRDHAGENIGKVLVNRSADRGPPIQMSDALSRNTSPGEFETLLANCNIHARRNFVDLVSAFPDEVERVLETFREVYKNDAHARNEAMSPADRLAYHQQHSKALMDDMKAWLDGLVDDKEVEPNSGLGKAITYLGNHWSKLTLFLRKAGAPLDSNLVERVLKRAIVHRKNSLFYKTANGARVGDMYLSLIHTAELNGANPFDYLVALQRHRAAAAAAPRDWMPWNYTDAVVANTSGGRSG
jgi:hypothetical protein